MTSTLGASPTKETSSESGAVTNAKDVALEKTQDARRKVGSQVSEKLRDQADQRSTAAGEQVSSIASALKETSSTLRSKGNDAPAKALDSVTERIEQLGDYLTQADGNKLLHDVEDAARQRPWAVAAALFGVGFAASRVFGASSKDRYVARGGYTPYPGRTTTAGLLETPERPYGGVANGNY